MRGHADFLHSSRGWRTLTVDPEAANTRGVNFWRKVGFESERLVADEDGREPFWRMSWPYPDSLQEAAEPTDSG